MILESKDVEDIASWIVTGLAVVLQRSDLTDKEIKKLRAHDIFANIVKALYKQRGTFVNEARNMFRMGPDRYLQTKKREL
jgi:hypothetical protein